MSAWLRRLQRRDLRGWPVWLIQMYRSASRERRIAACMVSFGIYLVTPFCPTRLNAADDPTRLRPLREPSLGLSWKSLSLRDLWLVAGLPRTRRWASNWLRLTLLVLGPGLGRLRDRSNFRCSRIHEPILFGSELCPHCPAVDFSRMDFDSTLGFPGEGPFLGFSQVLPSLIHLPRFGASLSLRLSLCLLLGICSFASFSLRPLLREPLLPCLLGALVLGRPFRFAAAMPLKNTAEQARAAIRATRPALPQGRPVLPSTSRLRERYWSFFLEWLQHEGIELSHLLDFPTMYVEEINAILTKFGRYLYSSGKPYNQCAETINCLTTYVPSLLRLMQGSWDLAYSWMAAEPTCHHIAMPWQVLFGFARSLRIANNVSTIHFISQNGLPFWLKDQPLIRQRSNFCELLRLSLFRSFLTFAAMAEVFDFELLDSAEDFVILGSR